MDESGDASDREPAGVPSPYLDPDTGVLFNEVAADTQEEIDEAADALLPGRLDELAKNPIPCTGDVAHLQAIHRVLFEGVFEWAGEFRITDIDKQGTDFVLAAEVETAVAELFAELAAEELLQGQKREPFVARLAYYYAHLNQIHPFREGNGRTQRLFWGQVALHAGWYVDFLAMDKAANNEASRAASQEGDFTALMALLDDVTRPAGTVEEGEAELRTSVRRKQRRRGFLDWLRSHANPDRLG